MTRTSKKLLMIIGVLAGLVVLVLLYMNSSPGTTGTYRSFRIGLTENSWTIFNQVTQILK